MTEKIYTYKGSIYKMKPLNLGLMHKAAPLLVRYRRLHYEYTKDIDMTSVDALQDRVKELKTAVSQLEQDSNTNEDRIISLKAKLSEAETELRDNPSLGKLMKLYSDTEGLAMYELITDTAVIRPVISAILVKVDEVNKTHINPELDLNEPEIIEFVKEVITDFFSYTLQSRPK